MQILVLVTSSILFLFTASPSLAEGELICDSDNPFEVNYHLKSKPDAKKDPYVPPSLKLEDSAPDVKEKNFLLKKEKQTNKSSMLQGKAEKIDWKILPAAEIFSGAIHLMRETKFEEAAELFALADARFDSQKKILKAEAKYYRAGCLVMSGENNKALTLYRQAWHSFQEHDPASPYVKPTLEQLCNLSVSRLKLARIHKLEKMQMIRIDRNITLVGHIEDKLDSLQGSVDRNLVDHSVHKCFAKMTCLETAELGSNVTNARGRWLPLLAANKTAVFREQKNKSNPVIKVKINNRYYSVAINLPRLSPGLRVIMLVTNGEKICAIDPSTYETWLLEMKLAKNKSINQFKWRKLTHQKPKSS